MQIFLAIYHTLIAVSNPNSSHLISEPVTGAVLKNSFKLAGPVREYIFTCPDPATKGLWLDTLRNRPRPMPPTNAEKRLAMVMLSS